MSVSLAPDDDGIGSAGEYGWGGAAATVYWADPAEELVVLFFTQVRTAVRTEDTLSHDTYITFTQVLGARKGPKDELRRLVYEALRG